jgi:hypothetical protein
VLVERNFARRRGAIRDYRTQKEARETALTESKARLAELQSAEKAAIQARQAARGSGVTLKQITDIKDRVRRARKQREKAQKEVKTIRRQITNLQSKIDVQEKVIRDKSPRSPQELAATPDIEVQARQAEAAGRLRATGRSATGVQPRRVQTVSALRVQYGSARQALTFVQSPEEGRAAAAVVQENIRIREQTTQPQPGGALIVSPGFYALARRRSAEERVKESLVRETIGYGGFLPSEVLASYAAPRRPIDTVQPATGRQRLYAAGGGVPGAFVSGFTQQARTLQDLRSGRVSGVPAVAATAGIAGRVGVDYLGGRAIGFVGKKIAQPIGRFVTRRTGLGGGFALGRTASVALGVTATTAAALDYSRRPSGYEKFDYLISAAPFGAGFAKQFTDVGVTYTPLKGTFQRSPVVQVRTPQGIRQEGTFTERGIINVFGDQQLATRSGRVRGLFPPEGTGQARSSVFGSVVADTGGYRGGLPFYARRRGGIDIDRGLIILGGKEELVAAGIVARQEGKFVSETVRVTPTELQQSVSLSKVLTGRPSGESTLLVSQNGRLVLSASRPSQVSVDRIYTKTLTQQSTPREIIAALERIGVRRPKAVQDARQSRLYLDPTLGVATSVRGRPKLLEVPKQRGISGVPDIAPEILLPRLPRARISIAPIGITSRVQRTAPPAVLSRTAPRIATRARPALATDTTPALIPGIIQIPRTITATTQTRIPGTDITPALILAPTQRTTPPPPIPPSRPVIPPPGLIIPPLSFPSIYDTPTGKRGKAPKTPRRGSGSSLITILGGAAQTGRSVTGFENRLKPFLYR